MDNLQLKQAPITRTGMHSRKLVADVFEAFVNPDIAAQFWFTKKNGRLEAGKQVKWDWEMYGISISVIAKVIEPNKRIVIEWPGHGRPTPVEWIFTPQKHGATFVGITHLCFTSDGDELVKQMTDSRDFRIPKPRPFQFGSVDRYFVIVIDRQIEEASRYKILFSSFSRCRSRLRRCETVGQREAT